MNQCCQITPAAQNDAELLSHRQNRTPSKLQTEINVVIEITGVILSFLIK